MMALSWLSCLGAGLSSRKRAFSLSLEWKTPPGGFKAMVMSWRQAMLSCTTRRRFQLMLSNSLRAFCLAVPVALAAGCQGRTMLAIEREMPPMPIKPAPFPEMRMLDPLVGSWTGTGDMIEPDPERVRASLPANEQADFKSTYSGGSTSKWTLDGAVLQSDGWYEMPGNLRGNYIEMWTWDPRKGRFRTWFSSDSSETGTGWATPSADGRCFHVKGTSLDAMAFKKEFEGCICIVDNNTNEWHFTEKGPMGRFTMRGVNKRQP